MADEVEQQAAARKSLLDQWKHRLSWGMYGPGYNDYGIGLGPGKGYSFDRKSPTLIQQQGMGRAAADEAQRWMERNDPMARMATAPLAFGNIQVPVPKPRVAMKPQYDVGDSVGLVGSDMGPLTQNLDLLNRMSRLNLGGRSVAGARPPGAGGGVAPRVGVRIQMGPGRDDFGGQRLPGAIGAGGSFGDDLGGVDPMRRWKEMNLQTPPGQETPMPLDTMDEGLDAAMGKAAGPAEDPWGAKNAEERDLENRWQQAQEQKNMPSLMDYMGMAAGQDQEQAASSPAAPVDNPYANLNTNPYGATPFAEPRPAPSLESFRPMIERERMRAGGQPDLVPGAQAVPAYQRTPFPGDVDYNAPPPLPPAAPLRWSLQRR